MAPLSTAAVTQANNDDIRDVQTTGCCIVGGGPAGAILALLLARSGIRSSLPAQECFSFARFFCPLR